MPGINRPYAAFCSKCGIYPDRPVEFSPVLGGEIDRLVLFSGRWSVLARVIVIVPLNVLLALSSVEDAAFFVATRKA